VLLNVGDNGAGVKVSGKAPEGIGLANTRARLQALYAENAKVLLSTSSAGGCTVTLELPYHENSNS
jgi:LytS/YehU family sensor histidine kinase